MPDKLISYIISSLQSLRVLLLLTCCLFLPVSSHAYNFGQDKIIATHYTGSAWAPAFWSNLNVNDVYNDLNEIKANHFNSIIIVVPWVGFQSSVKPIRYFTDYFKLLDTIIQTAKTLDMKVILRIGYAHEIGVKSQPDHHHRIVGIFGDKNILNAWFDYLDHIYRLTAKYDNVLFGFISWEDFFLSGLTYLPEKERKLLASQIGYKGYLKKYPLERISIIYNEAFESYGEIPLPAHNSPAASLFHEFWDQLLIKLYKTSKEHFPKLSMEVRVDCDPINNSEKYICHNSTFDLGGEGNITVIYYSPAWGAMNIGDLASAKETISRFAYLINQVRSSTNNLIFIDQFNFIDNTIGHERNTKIVPEEISLFLDQSFSIINDNTIGYALWAMKDIKGNVIKNGSFERGNLGWMIQSGKVIKEKNDHQARLLLKHMGKIEQLLKFSQTASVQPTAKSKDLFFRLKFKAKTNGQNSSKLTIRIFDNKERKLYQKSVPIAFDSLKPVSLKLPLFLDGILVFENIGEDIVLDELELFFVIQNNGIYRVDGSPKHFRDNIVNLNRKLATPKR